MSGASSMLRRARLRRPALGDLDRAALLPDPVVAGDVRARALQALGHLPRRAEDADGLVGYLVCSRYDDVWHLMNVAVAPGAPPRAGSPPT